MNRMFYLLRLKINGIKNIETPVELNFYKKTIKNDFDPEEYKVKAIYGENGSGKTAIITAVKLLRNLIVNKKYLADANTQKILNEIVNKKEKRGFIEAEFYQDFEEDRHIFRYLVSFEIREDEQFYINHEKLDEKKGNYSKNNYVTVYEVTDGELVKYNDNSLFSILKERTINLLDQRSFVSNILEKSFDVCKGSKENLYMLYVFLFAFSLNVYIDDSDNHSTYYLKETLEKLNNKEIAESSREYVFKLNSAILDERRGTSDIRKNHFEEYKQRIGRMCSFVQLFKTDLQTIEIEKKDHGDFFRCSLKMVYDGYTIDKEFESRGIKKIIDMFDSLDAACSGQIVFIDELDSNINDIYLDKIIEFFALYGNGQLCFTAHNLSPMSVLKNNRNSITFISGINTIHSWTNSGNLSPENAYRRGFIEDSPFNVSAADFLGILGGEDE